MASPARKPGEKWEAFKERRRVMNKELRAYLKGRFIWVSNALVPHPGEQYANEPELSRPIINQRVQGTYRKGAE